MSLRALVRSDVRECFSDAAPVNVQEFVSTGVWLRWRVVLRSLRPLRKDRNPCGDARNRRAILAVAVESQRRSQAVAEARTCEYPPALAALVRFPLAQYIAQGSPAVQA